MPSFSTSDVISTKESVFAGSLYLIAFDTRFINASSSRAGSAQSAGSEADRYPCASTTRSATVVSKRKGKASLTVRMVSLWGHDDSRRAAPIAVDLQAWRG